MMPDFFYRVFSFIFAALLFNQCSNSGGFPLLKVIVINTTKGQFHLPLQKVAENRADYYACEVDGHEKNSTEWQEDFEIIEA